eukprot:2061526-Amphidinium_carterae.1
MPCYLGWSQTRLASIIKLEDPPVHALETLILKITCNHACTSPTKMPNAIQPVQMHSRTDIQSALKRLNDLLGT